MIRPTTNQSCNVQACEEEYAWFESGSGCHCSSSCPWTYMLAGWCDPSRNVWVVALHWLAGFGSCDDLVYNISLPLVWNGYTYDKGRDLSDLHGTYNWPPIHVSYTLNRNCNFSVIRKPV